MLKSIFATLLAGTIGLTTMIAPTTARADAQFNRALAGVVALGIIAHQVNKHNNQHVTKQYHQPVNHKRHYKKKKHYKKKQHHYNPYAIPARCIFKFKTHNGWRKVVGPRCVSKRAPWVHLPRHCGRNIWTHKGQKYVMGRKCLRNKGYFFT